MKVIVGLTFFIFIAICAGAAKNHHTAIADKAKRKNIEDLVLSKVDRLSEVKSYFYKNRKHRPSTMIAGTPDSGTKYYWVKVGIDGDDRFYTMWNFYVEPKTFKVLYLDTMDGSEDQNNGLLTLTQWRRWRNDKRFDQMHAFKANKLVVLN